MHIRTHKLIVLLHRFVLPLPLCLTVYSTANAQNKSPTMSAEELAYQQTFQRATQAIIWGMPAVSMMGVRWGSERDLGAKSNDIIYMSHPMVSRHGFLTANNQVPYVLSRFDTTEGPVVLEVPPASNKTIFFGSLIDMWQVPISDVGPAGADAGKGGKYLILPPGYSKKIPEGYLVVKPKTYHTNLGLRPVAVNGGTLEEGVAYAKRLKAYPLSDPSKSGRYIDAFPKKWDTLPKYDLSFFEALATVVSEEPVQTKDLAVMGMLGSIGIKKGVPFKPDDKTKKALNDAITLAYAQMQSYFTNPGQALKPFWPDSQWQALNIPKKQAEMGFPFVNSDELMIDTRAGGIYFWATWLPKHLGKGSFYLMGIRDSKGSLLDGKSLYRLRVPKDVPARDFWSAIVYSMETKGFIENSNKVGISSYDKAGLKANADGSVDIYFGPKAPSGLEANWLPTNDNFFLIFRLYGPEKALFEKTWTLPELEKVTN